MFWWFKRALLFALLGHLLVACGDCKEGERFINIEKPCPDVNTFSDKIRGLLKEEFVVTANVKSKGDLCAYTVLLGEKASPVLFYYTNGVIIMGIGYEEETDEEGGISFKPFYPNYLYSEGEAKKGQRK